MLRFAERLEVRAVATNPVRYLVPEDAFLADALECMRKIVPIAQNHVTRANAEGYLKPSRQMRALFNERPDLCDATLRIAETCTFDLGLKRLHFPDFPVPDGRSASSVLAERCRRGHRGPEREAHAAGPGSPRPRARDDRRARLVGVLPDRGRHRRGHQGDGHPLRVPGLGCRLARLLPDRHLRRGPGPPRPAVRAVHEPDARRAAGHRHRRGVGAARGRLRHGALAPRRRPRGLRRHDRHVPGALGRSARWARRSACPTPSSGSWPRRSRTSRPATSARRSTACRSSTASTCPCRSSSCCSAWPSGWTASRVTSRCTRAASSCRTTSWWTGCRSSGARTATG